MSKLRPLIIVTCLLSLLGCMGGGGSSNTSSSTSDPANLDGDAASVSIALQATEGTAQALMTSDASGAALDITGAWVNVEKIEVELPEGLGCSAVDFELPTFATCEEEAEEGELEAEIELAGPFIFDLLAGTSSPDIGTLSFPSGSVQEIEVEIDDVEEGTTLPNGVPGDLIGHSLLVVGTVTLDGTPTPFSLRLDFGEEIEFEDLTGLEISEAVSLNQITIALNVANWLSGVDIGACVAEGDVTVTDGTIVISEESTSGACSDIEDTLKENIKGSGTLEEEDEAEDEGSAEEAENDEEEA